MIEVLGKSPGKGLLKSFQFIEEKAMVQRNSSVTAYHMPVGGGMTNMSLHLVAMFFTCHGGRNLVFAFRD